jgi:hypothetical protein
VTELASRTQPMIIVVDKEAATSKTQNQRARAR